MSVVTFSNLTGIIVEGGVLQMMGHGYFRVDYLHLIPRERHIVDVRHAAHINRVTCAYQGFWVCSWAQALALLFALVSPVPDQNSCLRGGIDINLCLTFDLKTICVLSGSPR